MHLSWWQWVLGVIEMVAAYLPLEMAVRRGDRKRRAGTFLKKGQLAGSLVHERHCVQCRKRLMGVDLQTNHPSCINCRRANVPTRLKSHAPITPSHIVETIHAKLDEATAEVKDKVLELEDWNSRVGAYASSMEACIEQLGVQAQIPPAQFVLEQYGYPGGRRPLVVGNRRRRPRRGYVSEEPPCG